MMLNRWQRIGVVISILWAIGVGYYGHIAQIESRLEWLDLTYRACIEIEKSTIETCSAERDKGHDIWMRPDWGNIAFIAFVPVIFGWIMVFIIIRVYRWIKAGKV